MKANSVKRPLRLDSGLLRKENSPSMRQLAFQSAGRWAAFGHAPHGGKRSSPKTRTFPEFSPPQDGWGRFFFSEVVPERASQSRSWNSQQYWGYFWQIEPTWSQEWGVSSWDLLLKVILHDARSLAAIRSGSGERLSELVMEFPAVQRVLLIQECQRGPPRVAEACCESRSMALAVKFAVSFSICGFFRGSAFPVPICTALAWAWYLSPV